MSPVSKILKTSILLGLVFMVTNSSAEVVTTDATTPPPKDLLMIKWCNCIEEENATSKHNHTKYSTLAVRCTNKALQEWGARNDILSWLESTDVMYSQPNCTDSARNAAKGDVDFAKDAGGLPTWIIVLIVLGAFLLASVLLFFVYRYMRASKGIAFLRPSSTNVGVPANVANGTPSNNKTQVEMDNIEKKTLKY